MGELKTTHHEPLLYENVLRSHYSLVYFDIDDTDSEALRYAVRAIRRILGRPQLSAWKTTHGYHVRAELARPRRGDVVLGALLEAKCDPHFVRRWLETGSQSLFHIRRGRVNRSRCSLTGEPW